MSLEGFPHPLNMRNTVRNVLKKYFVQYLTPDMTVYDVGCGDKPFAPFLKDKVKAHIGVDIEECFYHKDNVDLIGTAYDVPAEDGVADAVISSQLIEHLDDPFKSFEETARLLKKGGLFFMSAPFLYPLHAQPHDFGRHTEFSIEKQLKKYGFEIVEKHRMSGLWFLFSINIGIYLQAFDRGLIKKIYLAKLLIWFFKSFCTVLHKLEELVFKLTDKDLEAFRACWTVNYTYVARKK